MVNSEMLSHYLNLKYDVIVRRSDGKYTFFIRELNIRHTDTSLEKGYMEISRLKDAWITELAQEDCWEWIVKPNEWALPGREVAPRSPLRQLTPFFIKLASATLVILVLAAFASRALREFGYNMEKKLDKIVQLKPEEVEASRIKARNIAVKLRPVMLELKEMFEPEAAQNATRP